MPDCRDVADYGLQGRVCPAAAPCALPAVVPVSESHTAEPWGVGGGSAHLRAPGGPAGRGLPGDILHLPSRVHTATESRSRTPGVRLIVAY
ncbi:hypothetical protein NDU88_003729 [Pleurodeles waltl]|uniref:Uncharacterized protein n=1 Tax=Pleurodeles waltl TaxID=8319 RepID=A0AAV7VF05_PLEWA|nr:hypothetical protein NDU88_003729 [Pleurodeles waltl]